MTLLSILYWLVLILGVIFGFLATQYGPIVHNLAELVLFILIGLKIFRTPLQ